eukprot:m.88145 g.88145  ORF g.88145 m.88145 type:complete len:735 (+) comp18056_c0_seq4:28-2232(+)
MAVWRVKTVVLLAGLVALCVGKPALHASLRPRAFTPLPAGSITPKGWFLKQLELQAEGLSGYLALFWPDISSSVWIGGTNDGGLHERTPYWLNGIVPLAFLLNSAGRDLAKPPTPPRKNHTLCKQNVDMRNGDIRFLQVNNISECHDLCVATPACVAFVTDSCSNQSVTCWLKETVGAQTSASCRCLGFVPPEPASVMGQAQRYLNYIMDQQTAAGWLGPDDEKTGVMYWQNFNVLFALIQFMEGAPENTDRVVNVIHRYLAEAYSRMQHTPMVSWAAARGMDFALSVQYMLQFHPNGKEQMLSSMLDLIQQQTMDWETWFSAFKSGASPHGVNNAQALKSSAVWYVQTGNESFHQSSLQRMHNMDQTYGMPSGMFCADEILCDAPEQRMPSRGTELCAVVEAMFSYNTMFSVHGDVQFADRAERIAYNALPATWASKKGGDMWNHQYLQAVNEITAQSQAEHVWGHDGPDAELYGLAPNYGCCTANFNQGWPKFANMLYFSVGDKGVAVGAYAPSVANFGSGVTVEVNTSYPFEDTVNIIVTTPYPLPLYVRIPGWAHENQVAVNTSVLGTAPNGTMHKISLPAGHSTVRLTFFPTVRLEQWYGKGSVSVHRGALMYSLPITGNYTVLHTYPYDSRDYQVQPLDQWKFALDTSAFNYSQPGYVAGSAPFNHTDWACSVDASVRSFDAWPLEKGSAGAPPQGPVCTQSGCGTARSARLVPYGGTDLRISEFPIA